MAPGGAVVPSRQTPISPGQWFTMEVIAEGNHFIIRVNGTTTADYFDEKRLYSSGHIALQHHDSQTVAEFRKIEIKELNGNGGTGGRALSATEDRAKAVNPPMAAADPRHWKASIRGGTWKVEGDSLVKKDSVNTEGEIEFGEPWWSSYDLEFKIVGLQGKSGFMVIFQRSAKDGRIFEVSDDKGYTFLWCLYKGKPSGGNQLKNFRSDLGQTYAVLLKVRGADVTCFLNGKEWYHTRDERFQNGRVAISTGSTEARITGLKVSAPDGQPLCEGPPELPGQPATSAGRAEREGAGSPTASRPTLPVEILSGTWKVEGNDLVQSGGAGTILLGDRSLGSYDLDFKGQIASGKEGFNALIHHKNKDNFRFFHVGELAGKSVVAGFMVAGKEGGQSKPIATVKGRWYDVRVKVRGPEFWYYLDGKELFHEVDQRLTSGRIGLAAWDGNTRYRDIRVTTPEGETLWEGLPELPGRPANGTGH